MYKNKRGLIFLLDVLFSLSILVIGILLIFSYFYTSPNSTQPEFYASDLSNFFINTRFGQIDNSVARMWITNNTVNPDMKIVEKFAQLCSVGNASSNSDFNLLVNSTVQNNIPDYYGYAVTLLNGSCLVETQCMNSTRDSSLKSSIISSYRTVIFALNGSNIVGPYCMEVRVW